MTRCPIALLAALLLDVAGLSAVGVQSSDGGGSAPPSRSHTVAVRPLPPMDGRHLSVTVVDVVYEPGGVNPSHRHPCPVVGVVLEGAVRMQLQGREETVYHAGESFYETPEDVHLLSSNASQTERARFLAYFVCDKDVPALSVPTKDGRRP
ncbi:MAG: cupin domain-containing protein [Vicinamibacterales bacterium]